MVKKGFCILLTVLMLFSLTGCDEILGSAAFLVCVITNEDDRADKAVVFEFVRENEEELLAAIESGDFSLYENQGFIKNIDADETIVDFSCGGAGVGSETFYTGFYYNSENDLAAAWCAPPSADALTPSGNGYIWYEDPGDNEYYVEKICEYFYYYEAAF